MSEVIKYPVGEEWPKCIGNASYAIRVPMPLGDAYKVVIEDLFIQSLKGNSECAELGKRLLAITELNK